MRVSVYSAHCVQYTVYIVDLPYTIQCTIVDLLRNTRYFYQIPRTWNSCMHTVAISVMPIADQRLFSTLYRCIVHCTLYLIQCTVYVVHYTLYSILRTLYNVQCTSYIIHHTVYVVHYTVYSVHRTLYIIHCTLYIIHYTVYNVQYWYSLCLELRMYHCSGSLYIPIHLLCTLMH